jgi:hypothetical protein
MKFPDERGVLAIAYYTSMASRTLVPVGNHMSAKPQPKASRAAGRAALTLAFSGKGRFIIAQRGPLHDNDPAAGAAFIDGEIVICAAARRDLGAHGRCGSIGDVCNRAIGRR